MHSGRYFLLERMWGKAGGLDERTCLVIIYIKYQQVRILNCPTFQTLVLILGQILTRVFLFALWRSAVVYSDQCTKSLSTSFRSIRRMPTGCQRRRREASFITFSALLLASLVQPPAEKIT